MRDRFSRLLLLPCCCAGIAWAEEPPMPAPEREPELSGGVTLTALAAEGGRASPVGGASLDLVLNKTLGPGALVFKIQGNTAVLPGSVPAVFPGVDNNAGDAKLDGNNGTLQISELKYRWNNLPGESLTIGLMDVPTYMDLAGTANDEKTQFLNNSLVNDQAIPFPDFTLGLVYEKQAGETRFFWLVTGSHGIGDNPHKTYGDLAELDARGKRAFAAMGLSRDFGVFSAEAGVWGNNADHQSLNGRYEGLPNYGAYGIFGGEWEKAAFDLRAGYANPEVSPATGFLSVSLSFDLDSAVMGLGWAVTRLAPGAQGAGLGDSGVAEWYLRVPAGPVDATLDLQYVKNPAFDATVPATRIAGVRLRYAF